MGLKFAWEEKDKKSHGQPPDSPLHPSLSTSTSSIFSSLTSHSYSSLLFSSYTHCYHSTDLSRLLTSSLFIIFLTKQTSIPLSRFPTESHPGERTT